MRVLVLRFHAPDTVHLPVPGNWLHGLFLRGLVYPHAPELIEEVGLHGPPGEHNASRRPYTLGLYPLAAGTYRHVTLRVSALDDRLLDPLLQLVRQPAGTGVQLRLGSRPLAFESLSIERLASPRAVWEGAGQDETLEFEFLTPTVFSLGKGPDGVAAYGCEAEPEMILDSLRRTWNRVVEHDLGLAPLPATPTEPATPEPVHEYLLDRGWREAFGRQCHLLEDRTIRGVYPLAHGAQPGFHGRCRIGISGSDPRLLHHVNLLAGFARYGGVGGWTTMGMGQARRVFPPEPPQ